jgi:hypothetical protein
VLDAEHFSLAAVKLSLVEVETHSQR